MPLVLITVRLCEKSSPLGPPLSDLLLLAQAVQSGFCSHGRWLVTCSEAPLVATFSVSPLFPGLNLSVMPFARPSLLIRLALVAVLCWFSDSSSLSTPARCPRRDGREGYSWGSGLCLISFPAILPVVFCIINSLIFSCQLPTWGYLGHNPPSGCHNPLSQWWASPRTSHCTHTRYTPAGMPPSCTPHSYPRPSLTSSSAHYTPISLACCFLGVAGDDRSTSASCPTPVVPSAPSYVYLSTPFLVPGSRPSEPAG